MPAAHGKKRYVTYVSCELAVRKAQMPSSLGHYEVMITCDDERWARAILTQLGRMSLDVAFEPGHTTDIGPVVKRLCPIQGLIFEEVY